MTLVLCALRTVMNSKPVFVRMKTSMALFFIKATYTFYQQSKIFEEKNNSPDENFNAQIVGGIISAASFLECFINEVYTDISEGHYFPYTGIPKKKLELITKIWDRGIPRTARYSTLEKFSIFLDLVDAKPFDKGKYPYQDASILIETRNEMVHFEPHWISFEDAEGRIISKPHKFESKLKGRFQPSKLHRTNHFSFPHYCFSSDCLRWAFNSAKDMALDFSERANVSSALKDLDWKP